MSKKTLIRSTSGVRGIVGSGLDQELTLRYGAAFGTLLDKGPVVVGRDSRPSGESLVKAVVAGLTGVGRDVVEVGIVPTPTVEIAVKKLRAAGGICITASHNPAPWNALKFFDKTGEFIDSAQFKKLCRILDSERWQWSEHGDIGQTSYDSRWVDEHIKMTLKMKGVSRRSIKNRRYKVVVDAINGAGSEALPLLLERLGCRVVKINCDGDGSFVHEPEPVPANLRQLGHVVRKHKADLGMACDPDADRLALVDQKGRAIGEELTLAIAVPPVLQVSPGPTVINLSTSKVTSDVATALGSRVYLSKVGEANVVQLMRKVKAVIGGEGNGGVIYPAFHAGRDSLIAAALVLTALAKHRGKMSDLVETLPVYHTIKTKGRLKSGFQTQLRRFEKDAPGLLGKTKVDRKDGRRFDFEQGWVQIRTSNTEPIYRLIVETNSRRLSADLVKKVSKYFK